MPSIELSCSELARQNSCTSTQARGRSRLLTGRGQTRRCGLGGRRDGPQRTTIYILPANWFSTSIFLFLVLSQGIIIPISQVRKLGLREITRFTEALLLVSGRGLQTPLNHAASCRRQDLNPGSWLWGLGSFPLRGSLLMSLLTIWFSERSSQLNVSGHESQCVPSVSVSWASVLGLAPCQAGVVLPSWRSKSGKDVLPDHSGSKERASNGASQCSSQVPPDLRFHRPVKFPPNCRDLPRVITFKFLPHW